MEHRKLTRDNNSYYYVSLLQNRGSRGNYWKKEAVMTSARKSYLVSVVIVL